MPFVQHWLERKQLSEGDIRRKENTMLCPEKTDMMDGLYAQNEKKNKKKIAYCWPSSAIHYKGWLNNIFTSNDCIVVCSTIHQGLYSLRGRLYYYKMSRSLEAAIFGFILFQSHWNLTGTSAAALPRCLSSFRATQSWKQSNLAASRLHEILRKDIRLISE